MYCYLIVLRSHVNLVAFIGTVTTVLQASTKRLYLVGRRFDHGPRGWECRQRFWMQIILSILLMHSFVCGDMTVLDDCTFIWMGAHWIRPNVLLFVMSCSHFYAVAFIVYQVTAELHASAARLALTTFRLRDARKLWSSTHVLSCEAVWWMRSSQ
jgi:hypothetical protein